MFYPVGCIFETTDSQFNPNTDWCGTWEKIEDRFIIAASNNYTNMSTGGVSEYELSACIGACNGSSAVLGYYPEASTNYQVSHAGTVYVVGGSGSSFSLWNHSTPVVDKSSSSRKTTNIPPYYAAYIWHRTA